MLATLARQGRPAVSLTDLTRVQLARLAALTGCAVSGTKPEIISGLNALTDKHQNGTPSGRQLRILSIDMGIRNLAYALITGEIPDSNGEKSAKPLLEQWNRVSIGHEENASGVTGGSEAKESFEPAVMATHAVKYARKFADVAPTHILIERQRFRSGGASAVLEWSLRVGMLEAMLHAVFACMRSDTVKNGFHAQVVSVDPKRVNRFWLETDGTLSDSYQLANNEKSSSAYTKKVKIDLVRQLVEQDGMKDAMLEFSPATRDIRRAFREKTNGRKSAKDSTDGEVQLKKLDDVSDSLLQGLAWFRWQSYARDLVSGKYRQLI